HTEKQIVLIGIKSHGTVIAKKIGQFLKDVFAGEVLVLEIGIDKKAPLKIELDTSIDFSGKTIILVDDVANSGRTMLYALKPLLEHYPKKIQTMALVERTHKTFPVDVDYVGLSVSTNADEHISVEVEGGEVAGAYLTSAIE
ncbi:MAG TPA: phosphoribosyltransferase family protein, partial [Ferruginibacter sp.]|nr:phosphoribosyltransferase family protein [Ferruginibacter sp.]